MISKQTLGQIIRDWKDDIPTVNIIPRDLKIDKNIPANRAITITGSRRCGKTYFF